MFVDSPYLRNYENLVDLILRTVSSFPILRNILVKYWFCDSVVIYTNLFNRSPDQGGYDYWLGQLDSSAITRGAAMVGYSESDEYKQLMNNRVSKVSYYFLSQLIYR